MFLLGTLNFRFLDRYGFIVNPHCQTHNYKYTQMHKSSNIHTYIPIPTNRPDQAVCAYSVYAHKHSLVKV